MSNFREMYFEGEIDGKGLLDEIDRLRAEVSMLREYYDLANHKVITCGVAASHPDAGLASRGAYKEKWDSPQAEEVRKLRSEADSFRNELLRILDWAATEKNPLREQEIRSIRSVLGAKA